jgi:hypothetical protein
LIAGGSMKAAAAASTVSARQLRRWVSDPDFADQLVEGQEAMLASARGRLRALTDRSVDVLEAALEAGDVNAARWHLEGVGLLGKNLNLALSGSIDRELTPMVDLRSVLTPTELQEFFLHSRRLSAALRGERLRPEQETFGAEPDMPEVENQEPEDVIEVSEPPADPITAAARRVHRRHS